MYLHLHPQFSSVPRPMPQLSFHLNVPRHLEYSSHVLKYFTTSYCHILGRTFDSRVLISMYPRFWRPHVPPPFSFSSSNVHDPPYTIPPTLDPNVSNPPGIIVQPFKSNIRNSSPTMAPILDINVPTWNKCPTNLIAPNPPGTIVLLISLHPIHQEQSSIIKPQYS
jgi:hypothetical protein